MKSLTYLPVLRLCVVPSRVLGVLATTTTKIWTSFPPKICFPQTTWRKPRTTLKTISQSIKSFSVYLIIYKYYVFLFVPQVKYIFLSKDTEQERKSGSPTKWKQIHCFSVLPDAAVRVLSFVYRACYSWSVLCGGNPNTRDSKVPNLQLCQGVEKPALHK